MLDELHDLPLLPLRVTAAAAEPIVLPAHAGSTFRGALGASLRRLVCVRPDLTECAPYPHRDRCPYPTLFEPRAAGQRATSGFADLPRPYVLRAPREERCVAAGGRLEWTTILIGRAIAHLPYFVVAWAMVGRFGIGQGRGRFALERIDALDLAGAPAACVYDVADPQLRPHGPTVTPAGLAAWADAHRDRLARELTLPFLTPTAIKHQGEPAPRPEFHLLWRALQRRLSWLRLACGAGRPSLDFAATIRAAEQIELVECATETVAWERYSRRQGRRVPMGGFVGHARYRGELAPFLPALRLGALVGVGDNCTFGHGCYEIVTASPPTPDR